MIKNKFSKEFEAVLKKARRLKVEFLEPELLHPNSDTESIADVAIYIEAKYGLCKKFTNYIIPKLAEKYCVYVLSGQKNWQFMLSQWLQSEWRDYMVNQLHKVNSQLADEENREAFINTGAYYRSLVVKVI